MWAYRPTRIDLAPDNEKENTAMATQSRRDRRAFQPCISDTLETRLALSTAHATPVSALISHGPGVAAAGATIPASAMSAASAWTFDYHHPRVPGLEQRFPGHGTASQILAEAQQFVNSGYVVDRFVNLVTGQVVNNGGSGNPGGNPGGNTSPGNQRGALISYPVTQIFYRRPGSNPSDPRSYTYFATVSQTYTGGLKRIEFDNRIINSGLIPYHQASEVRFYTNDPVIWVSQGGVVSQVRNTGTLRWD
jgi:hypothetical protein